MLFIVRDLSAGTAYNIAAPLGFFLVRMLLILKTIDLFQHIANSEQLLKGTHSLACPPLCHSVTLFRWRRPPLPTLPFGHFFSFFLRRLSCCDTSTVLHCSPTFPLSPSFCCSVRLTRLPSLKPPSSCRQQNTKRVQDCAQRTQAAGWALCLAGLAVESRLNLSAEDDEGEVTERSACARQRRQREEQVWMILVNFFRFSCPFLRADLSCVTGTGLTASTPLLLDAVTLRISPPRAVPSPVMELESLNKNLELELQSQHLILTAQCSTI